MSDKISAAKAYLAKEPFPRMTLGANGTIVAADGRVVARMNLRHLTLTEAFAFGSAFIAAGEALDAIRSEDAA